MGARNLNRVQFTLERDVVRIFGRGTGASTADMTAVKGKGISTASDAIDRTGAGLYSINLTDKWAGLLMFKAAIIDATTPDDWEVVVVSETVASTKKVNIAVFKAGTAADLTNDEKLLFEIVVCNNSQKPVSF